MSEREIPQECWSLYQDAAPRIEAIVKYHRVSGRDFAKIERFAYARLLSFLKRESTLALIQEKGPRYAVNGFLKRLKKAIKSKIESRAWGRVELSLFDPDAVAGAEAPMDELEAVLGAIRRRLGDEAANAARIFAAGRGRQGVADAMGLSPNWVRCLESQIKVFLEERSNVQGNVIRIDRQRPRRRHHQGRKFDAA